MLFYLLISVVAAIFSRIAVLFFSLKKNKVISYILGIVFLILSASVFAFFAGARDPYMTPDSLGYGNWSWKEACQGTFDHFSEIFDWFTYPAAIIMWNSGHYLQNLFWYYFIVNFIYCFPAIVGFTIALKKYSWTAVICMGVLLYPMSFNVMRQFMANGFAMLAFAFTLKKKPIGFIISAFVAAMLHPSAFIIFIAYPAYWYLGKETFFPIVLKAIIVLVFAFMSTFLTQIFASILTPGTAWEAYGDFTEHPTGGFFTLYLVVLFFVFAFLCVIKKKTKQDIIDLTFLMVLLGLAAIAFSLAMQFDWLNRISYYFIGALLFLPAKLVVSSKDHHERFILLSVAIALVFFTGYLYNDLRESDHTVPYKFGYNCNYDFQFGRHVEPTDDVSNYLF